MRGVRMLMRALKGGQTAGILPDQVPSQGDGTWAGFFGRPAYTMTLPARLAATTGARIVFVLGERLPAGRGYRLRLQPFDQPLSGDVAADTQKLNDALEALIRQCPSQYLWGYNRYKSPAGVPAPDAATDRAP
jgi:KDO2-lipid IV(A) lauroyltransferase